MKQANYFLIAILALLFTACQKDPMSGIESHERAIESVALDSPLVQIGPAVVDRDASTVTVKVLIQPNTDLSTVKPTIISSYKSALSPASGTVVNFASGNNTATYTVTSETGETRKWTVILVPFAEALLGTYAIEDLTVYGGTGPQYGGGAVFDLASKNVWSATTGPKAEYDNTLTFTYTGVTSDGNTMGTVVNDAGADGLYANFIFTQNPVTDVNHFYRQIPEGTALWEHDYTANTVIFTFPDNSTRTCTFDGPQTIDLGNGLSKTITDNAFTFTNLPGSADNYNTIYSDFDKIVERPYTYWIDVKKQ
jgi:hypothetical protein